MKVINIRYRKPFIREGIQERLSLRIGVLLSFMIHGVVVAGLLFILACSEQADMGLQVVLILNNDGLPSEQPEPLSLAKADTEKIKKRVRQVQRLSPPPQEKKVQPEEKPLVAPQPVAQAVKDKVPAVPPKEKKVQPEEKPVVTPQPVAKAVEDKVPDVPTEAVSQTESRTSEGEGQEKVLETSSDASERSTKSETVQGLARGYLDGHFTYLRGLILKRLKYPPYARKRRWTGRVTASFVISESGSITELKVLSSSGHRILDENVLQTITDLGTLPKPPVKVQIVMPILYTLE